MKILAGALAVLLLLLGISVWMLMGAWKDQAVAEQRAADLQQALADQQRQSELLASRFDDLDSAVTKLHAKTLENTRQLDATLAGIDRIEKTEGDTDESVSCLDVPVPRQLDGSLR